MKAVFVFHGQAFVPAYLWLLIVVPVKQTSDQITRRLVAQRVGLATQVILGQTQASLMDVASGNDGALAAGPLSLPSCSYLYLVDLVVGTDRTHIVLQLS